MTLALDLISFQVSLFEADNEKYLRFMVGAKISRKIMLNGYNFLVDRKEIPPIEEQDVEEKTKLWQTSLDFCKGILDYKETLEYAKALYTLQYILKK